LSIVDPGPAGDGITLMQALHLINPQMPVIILTAHGSIGAVEPCAVSAYSYLTKPFEAQDLFFQMERALENRRLSSEVNRLKNLLKEKYDFDNIVAKSGKMQRVL
jgi:two-component system response regulator GlrR